MEGGGGAADVLCVLASFCTPYLAAQTLIWPTLVRSADLRPKYVQIVFSITFALSVDLVLLAIYDIAGVMEPATRFFVWRLFFFFLASILLAVPMLLVYIIAHYSLHFRDTSARLAALVGGVLFVLLLWKTSVFFPFKSEGILYGLLSIEAILSQIGVVGVITSALLSGYGAVSGAYNYFAGFVTGATVSDVKKLRTRALENVSAYSTSVATYLDALDEADRELVAKYTNTVSSSLGSMDDIDHELVAYPSGMSVRLFSTHVNADVTLTLHRPLSVQARARARHPVRATTSGTHRGRTCNCNWVCNFLRNFFATRLSADSELKQAVEARDSMLTILSDDLQNLDAALDSCHWQRNSRTWSGAVSSALGIFFAVYCVYRMFSALKNIIIPPSSVNDPISNLIAACQRPCFAKATFSSAMDCVLHLACGFLPDQGSVRSVMVQRTVIPMGSFLLLTVLLFSSARGFLMNSSNWFRHSGTSGFMPPAGIALLITLSLGSYFVATFLLMTSSVPPEYRRAMLHAAGDVDVTVFARLNDVIFLVSSFATILGVLVRTVYRRVNTETNPSPLEHIKVD